MPNETYLVVQGISCKLAVSLVLQVLVGVMSGQVLLLVLHVHDLAQMRVVYSGLL